MVLAIVLDNVYIRIIVRYNIGVDGMSEHKKLELVAKRVKSFKDHKLEDITSIVVHYEACLGH
jgi:hypothetical protein